MLLTVLGAYANLFLGLASRAFAAIGCTDACAKWDAALIPCGENETMDTISCLCKRTGIIFDFHQCISCNSTIALIFGSTEPAKALANFTATCDCPVVCGAITNGSLACPTTSSGRDDYSCLCSQTEVDAVYSCYYCRQPFYNVSNNAAFLNILTTLLDTCKNQGYVVSADSEYVTSIFLPDGLLNTQLAPAIRIQSTTTSLPPTPVDMPVGGFTTTLTSSTRSAAVPDRHIGLMPSWLLGLLVAGFFFGVFHVLY